MVERPPGDKKTGASGETIWNGANNSCEVEKRQFCENRPRTRRLSSHSLPLVAPIRLSIPPAGFGADCIIATRAVSGQPTAFFIFESGELCPYIFPQISGLFSRFALALDSFHAAGKSCILPVIWTCSFSYCQCCENQVLFFLFFFFFRQHSLFE